MVLRRSVLQMAGPHLLAQQLGNTTPKKRPSGDDTVSDLTGQGIEALTSSADNNVFDLRANGRVDFVNGCLLLLRKR